MSERSNGQPEESCSRVEPTGRAFATQKLAVRWIAGEEKLSLVVEVGSVTRDDLRQV